MLKEVYPSKTLESRETAEAVRKEKKAASNRRYRIRHRVRLSAKNREYYHLHKGDDGFKKKARDRQSAYRQKTASKERRKSTALEYRKKHKAELAGWQRKYRLAHAGDRAYLQKRKARNAVNHAVRTGMMFRGSCSSCHRKPEVIRGKNVIQGHHHRGHGDNHLLDVVWLCASCHADLHSATGVTADA